VLWATFATTVRQITNSHCNPHSLCFGFACFLNERRFFDKLQRDAKNDSIFGARREMQRRDPPCTEPVWTHQTAKTIGQECEKPQGNQGF
jgi:hypothetical protein